MDNFLKEVPQLPDRSYFYGLVNHRYIDRSTGKPWLRREARPPPRCIIKNAGRGSIEYYGNRNIDFLEIEDEQADDYGSSPAYVKDFANSPNIGSRPVTARTPMQQDIYPTLRIHKPLYNLIPEKVLICGDIMMIKNCVSG